MVAGLPPALGQVSSRPPPTGPAMRSERSPDDGVPMRRQIVNRNAMQQNFGVTVPAGGWVCGDLGARASDVGVKSLAEKAKHFQPLTAFPLVKFRKPAYTSVGALNLCGHWCKVVTALVELQEDEPDDAIELQMALVVDPAPVLQELIDSNDDVKNGCARANPKIGHQVRGIIVNEEAAKNWDESQKRLQKEIRLQKIRETQKSSKINSASDDQALS